MTMRNEMYTDGTYLRQNPGWGLEDAAFKTAYIERLLKRNGLQPMDIIEIGCGSGAILGLLSRDEHIQSLRGYDISPQAFAIASKIQSAKIKFYQEDILQRNDYQTDLLLVIDVFEHVQDFYQMLTAIRDRSEYFVFHIPLDLCCRTLLKPHVLLQQRSAVGHIHYFTKEMVQWMLQDTGFAIIDWLYTGSETDRGLDRSWKGGIKKQLRRLSFSLNRDLSVKLWGGYSMMILANKSA